VSKSKTYTIISCCHTFKIRKSLSFHRFVIVLIALNKWPQITKNSINWQLQWFQVFLILNEFVYLKWFLQNICRELWCLSGSWATPAHPALEGSSCGEGKKCIQGICSRSSSNVSRRSIANFQHFQHEASPNLGSRLSPNRTNRSKGFTRSFMNTVKGFLRSATSGAQDFFKLFTG